MVADECLNRTIKTLLDSHLGRLQAELYKEIKKNGQSRSLRVALGKFGDLCHLIKAQKCRPYTVNLLPCLVHISQRSEEEAVQEALANTLVRAMPVLGQFTNDKDIKMLLRTFLANLSCPSALVRRSAALSLVTVCQYSRKPNVFFLWLLTDLFALVLPVQEGHPTHTVVGVLVCLRHLIPHLGTRPPREAPAPADRAGPTLEHFLKIYELLLHHVGNTEQSVVTAALEALHQLLTTPPPPLVQALLSTSGISQSYIHAPSHRPASGASGMGSSLNIEEEVELMDDNEDPPLGRCAMASRASSEHPSETEDVPFSEASVASCEDSDFSSTTPAQLLGLDSPLRHPGSPRRLDPRPDEEGDRSSVCSSPRIDLVFGNPGLYLDEDVALKYCARLLASSFLLTGMSGVVMPDCQVRVSVKVLAMGCLTRVLLLYPPALFLDLHVGQDEDEAQKIWDVLEFVSHPDPQLCGQTALLVGHYLGCTLRLASHGWDRWARRQTMRSDVPQLADLVDKISGVVRSPSSVSCRTGLQATRLCVGSLLRSCHAHLVPALLEACMKLKDNTYWLVKVELAEMIGELSFRALQHLEAVSGCVWRSVCPRMATYQEVLVQGILLDLLGDEDIRVRTAVTASLSKCIPQLYYAEEQPGESAVSAEAAAESSLLLGWLLQDTWSSGPPRVHGLVAPFCCRAQGAAHAEAALSRLLHLLRRRLLTSSNKHLLHGVCQALSQLVVDYPVTVYSFAWTSALGSPVSSSLTLRSQASVSSSGLHEGSTGGGLLVHLVALLSPLALDLHVHQHLLTVAGHLLAGACFGCLQPQDIEAVASQDGEEPWASMRDRHLVPLLDRLFQHAMRLLNVFAHILEEQAVPTRGGLGLSGSPALSPIRRRSRGREDAPASTGNTAKAATGKPASEVASKTPVGLGHFASLPQYLKLYEVLKAAHSNYKVSLDSGSSEKFVGLLRAALVALGQLLEVAQLQDVHGHVEELLGYLRLAMAVEPLATVECVRQLLKALFGTNLTSLWEGTSEALPATLAPSTGLYHNCCSGPYAGLSKLLAGYSARSPLLTADATALGSWLSWMRRGCEKKISTLLKPGSKKGKAVLAAHIRLFEPVVLQALKQYTVSSSAHLQASVLDLLAQLVHLRVNYCLLDSDQIFIGFVIKQFEFIEEGQVLHAQVLIPQIFYFLVLLSYERYHSKPIISMPEIIQLCDRLMASGQPPDKYVIPALQAIVEDLFLLPSANRTDSRKELETQREVVVSVLLRLVQYPEVLELLLAVVHHSYQEGEDRWKKFSRQLIDVILPLMSQLQVRLDNRHALNVLQRLFDSVSPSVFRPVDILLKALLVSPTEPTACFPAERWMCLVLASVRVLLAQTREEVVLSRLADLALPLRVPQALAPEALYDPLDLQSLGDNTEKAVARYLIQVVNVYGKHLCKILLQSPGAEAIFPFQQMSCLLLYLTHMFQSGSFRRVATAAMEAVHAESSAGTEVCGIEETNEHFLSLAYAYPTLTVQWCNILTLVNYGQQGFWSRLLWPTSQPLSPRRNRSTPAYSCSSELVSQAGLILLCDYLCENIYDAEPMTWLIVNHVSEIIHLSSEPPVSDFISVIHRNPAASGLFVQAVLTRCETRSSASFVGRLLGCLEGIHPAQCGALLALLVEKVLPTPHLCLARSCEALAQRQVELLLAQPSSSLQELARLPEFMRATRLHRRHPHLLALLEKLLKGDPTQQLASGEAVDAAGAPKWSVNKEWFLCQVRERCCSGQAWPMECSQLLANLGYEDAQAILQLKDVSPAIVCASLRLGAQRCGTAESALYRAARSSVLSRLRRLVAQVPQLAAAECPRDLAALLADGPLWDAVGRLAPPTAAYLEGLTSLAADVPMDGLEDLVRFAVLCAEAIRWTTDSPERFSCSQLEAFLRALDCVLSCPSLASLMGLPEHASWVCSVAAAIYHLVSQLKGWRSFPVALQEPPADSLAAGRAPVREACVQVAELVGWLEHAGREPHIPTFIRTMLHRVITGVARLPLVNGFARTPPVLWQMQWAPQWEAPVPPPPADWLLDRDLLHEYIYRANLLGWISRQQFEETWMALLGVLNTSPSSERETPEDEQERTAVQCLSVRCITSLLLQSLRLPQPGNPHSSSLLHQPRDKPFAFVHTRCGKRLQAVRTPVHEALLKMLKLKTNMAWGRSNIDKFCRYSDYSLGQVSVEYMCVAVGLAEDVASASSPLSSSSSSSSSQHSPPGGSAGCLRREAGLAAAGLDLRSCLHFLLDLYTQWLGPPDAIGQPLLTETIRSVVMLSDIFMESSQFDWMLSLFMDMYRHHPSEDEVLAQYLVLGIAKAAAVVGLDWDMQEKMRKFVDLGLHSPMPSTQLLSLHGLLYLLAQPGDAAAPLLPSATDYLARHLDDSTLKDSELGMLAVWALAFFLAENYPKKQDLTSRIVQASLGLCSGGDGIPQSLHLCILHGLERLLLADIVDSQDSQLVVKVCVDRVRHGKPGESLSALGVMLSALYIAQGVNKRRSQPSIEMEPANSEQRAAALERATLLFDRIKRGYPFEADLISQILPGFLGEFFPAQDILNKVIGEFLSNQQPHPQFLAAVLFKVCEGLHEGNHEELMHDWVLLSLSNFTQRSPLAMAIWSLSCCFVAVTATVWLRALFPLIRGRMGLLEEHDRELFYISALDFERQLARDQHRAQFHSVVRSVAHPDTPYAELLKRLPQPS
ncbi:huntingtin isoform X2 [Ixodes scapularis]|nr:huntingtin isoform X2 [Ixodes scapularis]